MAVHGVLLDRLSDGTASRLGSDGTLTKVKLLALLLQCLSLLGSESLLHSRESLTLRRVRQGLVWLKRRLLAAINLGEMGCLFGRDLLVSSSLPGLGGMLFHLSCFF